MSIQKLSEEKRIALLNAYHDITRSTTDIAFEYNVDPKSLHTYWKRAGLQGGKRSKKTKPSVLDTLAPDKQKRILARFHDPDVSVRATAEMFHVTPTTVKKIWSKAGLSLVSRLAPTRIR